MLLAALLIGAAPVYADDLATPTLDNLAGQAIPDTDPVIYYPDSAYSLTPVPAGEDGAAPVGDNIITKFNYNSETGEFTPVYYQMSLKQTEYGVSDTNPDNVTTLTFQVNAPTDPVTITYRYITPDTNAGGNYTSEYINQVQPVTLENPDGSSDNHYQHVGGVSSVTNFENVLFKDNITDVYLDLNNGAGTDVDILGGALNNSADIDTLSGDFINNSINLSYRRGSYRDSGDIYAYGGALYNSGSITNLNADFISNYAQNGGAIANSGIIKAIIGNFIENGAGSYGAGGGAIYNSNTIENITGDFIANSTGDSNRGGAIYNTETAVINTITGDFISNSADSSGGAIYNRGTIGDITGDFISNSANSSGGAIDNDGTIGNITGDFIGNSADYDGGAIDNSELIKTIIGDFISNSADNSGGAISSYGFIGIITGDFINNSAISINEETGWWGGGSATGGAIDNDGTIGNITGDFINNSTSAYAPNYTYESTYAYGGAIYNSGLIKAIIGNFIENNASGTYGSYGGAIYNSGTIDAISGDFINNSVNMSSEAIGGAIFNSDTDSHSSGLIKNIIGNFIGNSAKLGGAIYNAGTVETITGNFIGNTASQNGGAIDNDTGTIETITGDFINNSASQGGAIYNEGKSNNSAIIQNIIGNFVNNSVSSSNDRSYGTYLAIGGAILNKDTIETISGDFISNSAILIATAETNNNNLTNKSLGGAIYNTGTIKEILNASFINNFTKVDHTNVQNENNYAIAKGGAIYSTTDLNIIADNAQSVFSGNYTETIDDNGNISRDDNAIYLDAADAALNFNLKNNGSIVMADNIDGVDGYNVNITGDNKDNTTFYMFNDIRNSNLFAGNTTLNTVNNSVHVYDVNSFTLTDDTNFVADVDLANKEMDRLTADSYGEHNGNLNVIGMNLLSDAVQGESVTAVYFAEPDLKNNVVNAVSGGTGDLPDSFQTTAYTPIYKYNVIYDKDNQYDGKGDGGYFVFAKGDIILPDEPDEPDEPNLPIPPTGGGTTGNPSDAFNPAVLATPVGNLAAGQAAMNEAFKYVFEHADAFTQLPSMERYAKINANKYALSTDFNENLPSYAEQLHNNAVWFRPYTTFETMNIKNGPKVDAITYGSLVGFDGDFKEMKNGWSRIFTGYAGYMGSSLNYSGVDTTMNGGLLGFTETFYKGNFWTAITASAGASVGESHTMYGKEDYTSLLAGVGSKTGYNFEFKDGKFIIQPIMFLSYTFVNTFDYKNAAGVSIESDPLHTIQLNPSVRFIANLKGGWQPYASVGMVWNLMNESKVTANNVKLPEMSVKPYVEYGVGVQRNWADKFTAFLQAMIRNGGRNGVALTGGFRFMLGSEPKNSDKPKVKKEIKSL